MEYVIWGLTAEQSDKLHEQPLYTQATSMEQARKGNAHTGRKAQLPRNARPSDRRHNARFCKNTSIREDTP